MQSDTDTMERRSRLEQFAESIAPNATAGDLVPVATGPAQMPAIFGAQKVAVYRDDRRIFNAISALAAAAGDAWYYRFPVQNRRENRTDWIEGPSIKLANNLARLYGNCEVDCRVEDFGTSFMFYARFVDLETGFALTRPFQQRKGKAKIGGADAGRRDDMDLQIGASKAIRNVIVNALETYSDFAFEEARNAIVERIGKDLPKWRENVAKRLANMVDLGRVEAVVGRKAKDWLAPDIARVLAMGKAVADGMASLDETFPPPQRERVDRETGEVQDTTGEQLERFADRARDMVDAEAGANEPAPQVAGADDTALSDAPAADPDPGPSIIGDMISQAMQMARDPMKKTPDRVASINAMHDEWLAICGSETLARALVMHASKVAQGALSEPKARQYLSALRVEG